MVRRGLFIGRFQPFHKGHLKAIQDVLKKVDELIIVVGSCQKSHELDNPYTAGERFTMIRRALDEAGVNRSNYWIIPVPDIEFHASWVAQVASYTPKFDIVYSNDALTKRLFLEAEFLVEPIPLHKREIFSATEIRRRMLNLGAWEELVPNAVAEFLREIDGVQRIIDLSKKDV